MQPDIVVMCHAAVASGSTVLSEKELEIGNVALTQTVLNCFPNAKIIYVSTVAVYGDSEQIISESTRENPQSNYAISKLKAEKLVQKIPLHVIIRLSSLYGNGMKENTIIPIYCKQALKDKRIVVWGDGSRMQNYIHISDAIQLIGNIVENDIKVDFPILGVSNKEYSNAQLAEIIGDYTHSDITFNGIDISKSVQYNNTISQKAVNWQPEMDLGTGIKQFLEWK
jgi:UDP-glucose 4-epimerase